MPPYENNIEQQLINMEVARLASTVLDVTTGVMGGVAINALLVERKPVKAVLTGVLAAGFGWLAYRGNYIHEDAARRVGALQTTSPGSTVTQPRGRKCPTLS